MSKFIEVKLNCQYEDGKAFYEVTENEEDLLYYKKVLRPQTKEVFSSSVDILHGFRSHHNSYSMRHAIDCMRDIGGSIVL